MVPPCAATYASPPLPLVITAAATCADWFSGPVNDYLGALATYKPGVTPSVSCRQSANTVHRMELVGPEPGANLFFDDPRKVRKACSLSTGGHWLPGVLRAKRVHGAAAWWAGG